jgi:hypothetical protein
MTLNNKKPFWKSFPFSMILIVAFFLMLDLLIIFYIPDRKKPNAIRLETKNAKCTYIGNVDGTSMDAYKLTVDSVEYILVQSNQGVTLTRVK